MKEVKRANDFIFESVKETIRKVGAFDRKEIFELIKDIKRYPTIRLDNMHEKLLKEQKDIGDSEMLIVNKNRSLVGRMCFVKPFFNKSVYYYKIPLYINEPGTMNISFFVDLENEKGIILFNYTDDEKIRKDFASGIISIKVSKADYDKDINSKVISVIEEDYVKGSCFHNSDSLIYTIAVANNITYNELLNAMVMPIMLYLGDLHINNYYPFETGVNKRGEGGEVIFLNRIPYHPGSKNAKLAENEKSPHMRRGYWWTMRADRYKSHPHYQRENANYKQASWIGPEQFNWQGKSYKIVLPKDESLVIAE